jgi:hypothetical protein
MTTVIMSIEGVLTEGSTDTNSLNYESSVVGRSLFHSLRPGSRVILLSQDHSKDRVRSWLSRENIVKYSDLICRPLDCPLEPDKWRIQKVKDLIGIGFHIAFFIDSDPHVISSALDAGVCGLLFASSATVPGRNDKSFKYTPWYDLVETIERHSLIRASSDLMENRSDG